MSPPGTIPKSPVDELVDQTRFITTTRGFHAVLPCRAAVVPQDPRLRGLDHPPPPGLHRFTWKKLNPGQQALLVLAHLRKGETFAEFAAGFEVGTTTAWRYVSESVALLAARAPKLRTAVRDAKKAGYALRGPGRHAHRG